MEEGNNFVVPLRKGSHIVIDDNNTMVEIPYDCNVVVTFVVRPKRGEEAPAGFAPENVKVPAEIQQTEAFQLYLTRTAAVSVFMESHGRRNRDGFDSFRSLSRSIPEIVEAFEFDGTRPGSIERTSAVLSEMLKMQTRSFDLEGKDTTEMVALGNVVQ